MVVYDVSSIHSKNRNVSDGKLLPTCNYQTPKITMFWLLTSPRLQSNTVIHKHMLKGEICPHRRFASQADSSYCAGHCHCCCMGTAYDAAADARTPFPHLPLLISHRLPSSPCLSLLLFLPLKT